MLGHGGSSGPGRSPALRSVAGWCARQAASVASVVATSNHWPANMRVQRTRSSASPPHSPLTRWPLGSPRDRFAYRRLAWLALAGLLARCATSDLGSGGRASLSGAWEGTLEERQVGKCALGADRSHPTDRQSVPTQVQVVVEPDGIFTAWERAPGNTSGVPPDWRGDLADDLSLTAIRTSKAECGGQSTSVTTQLKGSVKLSATAKQLEISGREESCPALGCAFSVTYRLAKK